MYKINGKEKYFVVLGAGGTGSWLVPTLSKMTNNILVIDGDIVEEKNVARQNFFKSDVNKNKAQVIGERYNISYINDFVSTKEQLQEIIGYFNSYDIVFVGCLDNNGTRHLIQEVFKELDNAIWLDSGNAERHGQTYVAIRENKKDIYKTPIELDEAFQSVDGDERRPDQISCAEQSASAPQNITANMTAASTLLSLCAIVNTGGMLIGNKFSWDTRVLSADSKELI